MNSKTTHPNCPPRSKVAAGFVRSYSAGMAKNGRTPQPEKLTGSEAPEGWIKRIDRPREGKVWVGFFHFYVADRR